MTEGTPDNADLFAAFAAAAIRLREIEKDARTAAEFFEERAREVHDD